MYQPYPQRQAAKEYEEIKSKKKDLLKRLEKISEEYEKKYRDRIAKARRFIKLRYHSINRGDRVLIEYKDGKTPSVGGRFYNIYLDIANLFDLIIELTYVHRTPKKGGKYFSKHEIGHFTESVLDENVDVCLNHYAETRLQNKYGFSKKHLPF